MSSVSDSSEREVAKLWLPLAVVNIAGVVEGSTRLQKLVFLGEFEGKVGEYFTFTPHHHGPYSSDLAQQISFYKALGFVTESQYLLSADYGGGYRHDYKLTPEGIEELQALEETKAIRKLRERLESTIRNYMQLPLNDLLEYVYSEYLPGKDKLEETQSSLESHYRQLNNDWQEREDSFYPLSWFVLAVLEQITVTSTQLDALENDLDRQVLLNAACDIAGAAMDLLQVLDKYSCDDTTRNLHPVCRAVRSQLLDLHRFYEDYASKRGILKPLSKLKLEDVTTEEERTRIISELRQLL